MEGIMNSSEALTDLNFTKKKVIKTNSYILLGIILFLGLSFRLYGLDYQSMWTDELASWEIAQKNDLKSIIDETIHNDQFPPLYYFLIHYIQKYLGDSELILRFPSAVGGLLSVLAIFFLGRRLYSEKEGLVAAAMMAVMWCPIYYSQEARNYIFLILFSILSVHFWLPIIECLESNRKPQKRDLTFYVIFSILCCYTHYFGGYLIALQGLAAVILFLRKRTAWGYILLIYLLIGVAFSPWLPAFLHHLNAASPGGSKLNKPISLTLFLKFIGFIFNAQKSPFVHLETYSRFDIIVSASIMLTTLGLIFSLFFRKIFSYIKNDRSSIRLKWYLDPDIILLLWLVIPFLLIYIVGKISFFVFSYRYFLISLPPAYLLLSRSITKLFSSLKLQSIVASMFVIIFAIHLIYYKEYYSKPDKYQYREAVNYVIENDKYYSESKIIGYAFDNLFDYYLQRKGFTKKVDLYVNWKKDMQTMQDQINLIEAKYVWLVSAHLSPDEKFIDHFSSKYKIIKNQQFIEANVWLFEKI